MTEQTPQSSGSRWEPSASDPAAPESAVVPDGPDTGTVPIDAGDTSSRSPGRRHRLVLGGAAAGLVLVSGLGGFAVGHAAADQDGGQFGRHGTPPDFDGDGGPGTAPDGQGFPGGGSQGSQDGQTPPDSGGTDDSGSTTSGT